MRTASPVLASQSEKANQLDWGCMDQLLRFQKEVCGGVGALATAVAFIRGKSGVLGFALLHGSAPTANKRPHPPARHTHAHTHTRPPSCARQASDDIRLSVRLFKRCLNDQRKFCADTEPGHMRVQVRCAPLHRVLYATMRRYA